MGMTRTVPMGAWPYLETADHILHAGDVCDPALLEELSALAPLTVVMGNCDGPGIRNWGATDQAEVNLGGIGIGMIHDAGLSPGRRQRLRGRFQDARVVVFGHSHMPYNEDEEGRRRRGGDLPRLSGRPQLLHLRSSPRRLHRPQGRLSGTKLLGSVTRASIEPLADRRSMPTTGLVLMGPP